MNRIIFTIGGFILMGISKIFNYYNLFRIFGKTGDLIGVAGLIAAIYGLWPIISPILKIFFGINDNNSSSSTDTNWLEKLRKNAKEAKIREEEKEKKHTEEMERKGRELNEEIRRKRKDWNN